MTRPQQDLLWNYRGVTLEQMDDLARIWMTSEKVSSIPDQQWRKTSEPIRTNFCGNFLKSPPVGRFEVVEPLLPPT